MKKFLFSILIILPFMLSARGGVSCSSHSSISTSHVSSSHVSPSHSFTSESHSYHPSSTSRNNSEGNRAVRTFTHINSVSPFHSSEPINKMTPNTIKFYSNNPSYIRYKNNYIPFYQHNSFFWHYVILNNRRHRNDTIRAKNKTDLIQKVNNHKQ